MIEQNWTLDDAQRAVGVGWHDILRRLFAPKPVCVHIVQVKEKFGVLRVYAAYSDVIPDPEALQTFESLITGAEAESARTCEDCGQPGTLRPGGWMRTLCSHCDWKWQLTRGKKF